ERAGPVRVALFTNNYLPFCGGVPTSVETLRAGLEAAGHEAWVFGPRFATGAEATPRVVRYPSIPAATYPEFALAVPYSRRAARLVAALDVDVFHAHHPFLLGPAARTLPRPRRCPACSLRRAPRPREERGPDPPRVRARRLDGVGGAPDPGGARHGGAPAPAARGDARGV